MPGPVQKLKVGDLFSGIGGFSLGLESTGGFETAWFCEANEYCRQILRRHWPNVPIFPDIKEFNFNNAESVDLICGGFPCQPFSVAGGRKGTDDDRYLWPQMLGVIKAYRPTWVIAENVAGLTSMGVEAGKPEVESRTFTRFPDYDYYEAVYTRQEIMLLNNVCESIEKEGYAVQPLIIPACAVDAPHRRDRLWILAHAESNRRRKNEQGLSVRRTDFNRRCEDVANAEIIKGDVRENGGYHSKGAILRETGGSRSNVADPRRTRRQEFNFADITKGPGYCAGGVDSSWCSWTPEPGVGRVANGIPDRVDRLRSLGNAVVPQVVNQIGLAILEVENALSACMEV